MMDPVKNFIETSIALRNKYNAIKFGKIKNYQLFEQSFKPIITPLQNISTKISSNTYPFSIPQQQVSLPALPEKKEPKLLQMLEPAVIERLKIIGPVASAYLQNYFSNNVAADKTFGIHMDNNDGEFYIGKDIVKITDDNISVCGKAYRGTPGLWELLTLSKPNKQKITNADLACYEDIILTTNCHKHNYDPNGRVKSSGWKKYINYIKPMVDKINLNSPVNQSSGSGLQKVVTNTPVEYVYWNTLDELLERLYIVYGEIKAGNTNPNLHNELVNILQEIKEI